MACTPKTRLRQREKYLLARSRLQEFHETNRRQRLKRRRPERRVVVSATDLEAAVGWDKSRVDRPLSLEGDVFRSNAVARTYARGDAGEDTLVGGEHDDVIYGGNGDDVIFGQRGADVFHVNYTGLADGGANPDDYADFRSNTGDRFDHSEVLNIVLATAYLTDPSGPSPLAIMTFEETPEWLANDAEWLLVTWEQPPLESLDGITLDVLPTIEDSNADAELLTEVDVVDELLPIEWTEADGGDASALDLGAHDALYLALDDQAPADEVVFDEPIDLGTVDSYFGDLVSSSSSNSKLSKTVISRTSWLFG